MAPAGRHQKLALWAAFSKNFLKFSPHTELTLVPVPIFHSIFSFRRASPPLRLGHTASHHSYHHQTGRLQARPLPSHRWSCPASPKSGSMVAISVKDKTTRTTATYKKPNAISSLGQFSVPSASTRSLVLLEKDAYFFPFDLASSFLKSTVNKGTIPPPPAPPPD